MEDYLRLTEDQLRMALADMTAGEVEQIIIYLDNHEASRVLRSAANEVYNQKSAQRDAARLVANLTDEQKAALVQHIQLEGIEPPFKAGTL